MEKPNLIFLFIVSLLLTSCSANQQAVTGENEFENGAVVTAHPLASQVGLDVLKKGGNAVDAAVAVKFALAVVYPNAGNLGGGGFLVYRSQDGQTTALDFREKAPGKAHRDMYLDPQGNPIKDLSLYGHLASGVPGSVAGMDQAHQRYGTLSWKELLEPAIQLASEGFAITERQAEEFNRYQERFKKFNPNGAAIIRDQEWNSGDRFTQPELAETLKRI
ncbi:MAG: gamma-glutamyltransferase, partial [Sphingobacterium sp.]